MTAIEDAQAARAKVQRRLTGSRLGKSTMREMDADMLALRAADESLDVLIAEHERLLSVFAAVRAEVTRPLGNWDRPTIEDSVLAILDAERLTAPPAGDEREALGEDALRAYLAPTEPRPWSSLSEWEREKWIAAGMVGFRRQGPITDEWEYGIRPEDDDVVLGYSPMPTFEAARTRANNIYGGWVIVRRRKAGPWEPVEAERSEQ